MRTKAPAKKYPVAKVSEIPPGERKIVEVDGKSIGIFNVNGSFYALRNVCPHKGAELCKGLLRPLIVSDKPGEFKFIREGEILRCPWHQYEFDIKTGVMVYEPESRTKTYEVTVEKACDVSAKDLVAETFDVSVEDELIIIQM